MSSTISAHRGDLLRVCLVMAMIALADPGGAYTGSAPQPSGETADPGGSRVWGSDPGGSGAVRLVALAETGGADEQAIPAAVLAAYRRAANAIAVTAPGCGLTWWMLAGIGKVESDHAHGGRLDAAGDTLTAILGPPLDGSGGTAAIPGARTGGGGSEWERAVGPMQFLPATWAVYGGDGDPNNIDDAALAAGHYLCAGGPDLSDPAQLASAVHRYNPSSSYVAAVLAWDRAYATDVTSSPATTTAADTTGPAERASTAVGFATAQLGLPYIWGGNGPANGDPGFDCSGLTHAAYAAAGIATPRTAQAQYDAGPRLAPDLELQPGDLVFYGSPDRVHHVGLYIGDDRMINAPTFGEPVQVAPYRWAGDDYVGAARPAALPGSLPPLPANQWRAARTNATARSVAPRSAAPAPVTSRSVVPVPAQLDPLAVVPLVPAPSDPALTTVPPTTGPTTAGPTTGPTTAGPTTTVPTTAGPTTTVPTTTAGPANTPPIPPIPPVPVAPPVPLPGPVAPAARPTPPLPTGPPTVAAPPVPRLTVLIRDPLTGLLRPFVIT